MDEDIEQTSYGFYLFVFLFIGFIFIIGMFFVYNFYKKRKLKSSINPEIKIINKQDTNKNDNIKISTNDNIKISTSVLNDHAVCSSSTGLRLVEIGKDGSLIKVLRAE